jgi:hypothetical protein
MRTGSDPVDDPPAAGQPGGRAVSSLFANARLTGWHGDLAVWLDQLGWLRTLSDQLTGVLGPLREGTRTIWSLSCCMAADGLATRCTRH